MSKMSKNHVVDFVSSGVNRLFEAQHEIADDDIGDESTNQSYCASNCIPQQIEIEDDDIGDDFCDTDEFSGDVPLQAEMEADSIQDDHSPEMDFALHNLLKQSEMDDDNIDDELPKTSADGSVKNFVFCEAGQEQGNGNENTAPTKRNITFLKEKRSVRARIKDFIGDKKSPMDFICAKMFLEQSPQETVFSLLEYSHQSVLLLYDTRYGYYRRCNCDELGIVLAKKFQDTALAPKLNNRIIKEVFSRLLRHPHLQVSYDEFDRQDRYLNVRNGVVDLEDGALLKHDKSYRFLSVLPIDYKKEYADTDKNPQKFKKMLERHFPSKEDRKLFLESLAYLISWKHGIKLAFFWIGEPHTGKSTFLRILDTFLGDVVTHHSLRQISSKHGPADLETSRVNICAEVEKTQIKNLDNFKAITGNDSISIEAKFQQLRTMKCMTDLLLVGNDFMPLAKGLGEPAIYDRIMPIKFLNPYKDDEKIPLFDEMLINDEGSKIFAVIVRTLCKLRRKNYKFSHSKLSDQEKLRFMLQNSPSNSVDCFIEDRCRIAPEGYCHSKKISNAYNSYCSENAFDPICQARFFSELQLKIPNIKRSKRIDVATGRQCRGYCGIQLV